MLMLFNPWCGFVRPINWDVKGVSCCTLPLRIIWFSNSLSNPYWVKLSFSFHKVRVESLGQVWLYYGVPRIMRCYMWQGRCISVETRKPRFKTLTRPDLKRQREGSNSTVVSRFHRQSEIRTWRPYVQVWRRFCFKPVINVYFYNTRRIQYSFDLVWRPLRNQ